MNTKILTAWDDPVSANGRYLIDSSRYERMRQAPSDEILHKMWVGWATLFAFFGAFSFTVWLSILLSKRARKSPFNVSNELSPSKEIRSLFPSLTNTLSVLTTTVVSSFPNVPRLVLHTKLCHYMQLECLVWALLLKRHVSVAELVLHLGRWNQCVAQCSGVF